MTWLHDLWNNEKGSRLAALIIIGVLIASGALLDWVDRNVCGVWKRLEKEGDHCE